MMIRCDSVQRLEFENSQLRAELRAQQAVCQKLRREKEEALQAIEEAVEEIRGLHEELEMRERMFQEFRDAKEKELSEVTRIRQDLEMRLQSISDSQETAIGIGEPTTSLRVCPSDMTVERWSLDTSLPQLSAGEIVESLTRWEGMEDTIVLFQDMIRMEKGLAQQLAPSSPWLTKWRFVIRLYISASSDVDPIVDSFMKDLLPALQEQCKANNCTILPIHLCSEEIKGHSMPEDHLLSICSSEVQRSDLFLSLLKSSADTITKSEVEYGYLNNPSARPTIFLFLPESEQGGRGDGGAKKLKLRVQKAGKSAKVITGTANIRDSLHQLSGELQRMLKDEFSVTEWVGRDNDAVFERIGLLEDVRVEWEQTQLLKSLLTRTPSIIGMDEVFERLEGYLNEEGPVAPYLVTGHPGLGKSTLLAKWIDHLKSSCGEGVLVLHHFVKCLCSSSAEPCVIFRRLLQKILVYCGETGRLPSNPSQLEDSFTSSLETLSTHLGKPRAEMAILVIDGADLVADCEKHLSWILQPLPNNIRVVLTANEDNYPDSWRALPSPSIPTPTSSDIQRIVENLQDSGGNTQSLQVGMLAIYAPPIPLWCVVATKHVLSLADQSGLDLDELIESFSDCEDIPDLVKRVLDDLESSSPQLAHTMEQVLQLVYWCRNGLLLTEVMEISSIPASVITVVVHELQKRAIISDVGGLIYIPHDQILEAVQMKYCVHPGTDYMMLWTDPLVRYFSRVSSCLMSRCTEELPWLLKRAEWKEELYHTIINIDMFIQLYSSGRSAELLSYWQFLDPAVSVMATQYYKSLRKLDEGGDFLSQPTDIISLYGTVGKILRNLMLIEEALPPLQHFLELHETHSDPDGPEVGLAMSELAALYAQSGRLITAEGFYKQALQLLESACGEESQQVLKVLEPLSAIYKKLGNDEMEASLLTRIYAMKKSQLSKASASGVLKTRAQELEEFCVSCEDDSLESAKMLNQFAVILALYGDPNDAEGLFMRSLKAYEMLLGEDNMIVLHPLRNLGAFYTQSGKHDWAISLHERAYEIALQHLPVTHPDVVDIIGKLALLYREQGRLDAAEPLQRKLVELKEKEHGTNHLSVAKAINNLAVICCLQHSYEQAIPLYDQALKIYEENLGLEHPTVLAAVKNKQLAFDLLHTQSIQIEV